MSELNIPDSWTETSLEIACQKVTDGTHLTPKLIESGIPFITVANVDNGVIDFSNSRFLSKSDYEKYKDNCNPQKGDVLFSKDGTVGKVCLIDFSKDFLVLSSLAILRPQKSILNSRYLRDYLLSPFALQQAIDKKTGSAIRRIILKDLREVTIPIPPYEEQERIVQKIESCFYKIEETEQNLNKVEILLEKYRESLLAKAFRGELIPQNPDDEPASVLLAKIREERAQNQKGKKKEQEFAPITDDEKPFDIPESWEWVKLGDVLKKITDGTHHSPPNTPSGEYKYITAKNVRDWGLDLDNVTYVSADVHKEIYSRCDPQMGDVFLIKDGATSGISCLNSLDEPFSMLSSVALLRVYPFAMNNEYLLYYLKSPLFQELVSDGMAGAAIKRITLSKINEMIVPLPPIKEQLRIIEELKNKLNSILHVKSQIKTKIIILERTKESVLKKAFEGRLVDQIDSEGTGHELLQKILEQKKQTVAAKESTKKKVTKKVSKKKTTKK